jgi:phytoene synthase
MLLPSAHPDAALLAEARATTRRVARTFALACRLLPRAVRDDVYLLYLVLRTLDDSVDEAWPDAEARLQAVEAWGAGGAGGAEFAEARILARLAARHPLPRQALLDFCAGMREDLCHVPPATEADVDRYCYRVAGTVGIVMTSLLGVRADVPAPEAHRAAAALGIAMQRTNILRDLDEDAAAGRCYVAAEAIAAYGAPVPGARAALLRDQIARADARYEEGLAGLEALAAGRTAIRAAAVMYREILRQLEREGLGTRPGRAVVPPRRKLLLAAHSVATPRGGPASGSTRG